MAEMYGWDAESVVTTSNAPGAGAEILADLFATYGKDKVLPWQKSVDGDDENVTEEIAGVVEEYLEDCDGPEGSGTQESRGVQQARADLERMAELNRELRAASALWQELIRARAYVMLQRGRFTLSSPDGMEEVPERVFCATRTFHITELETAGGLYAALLAGRVVANVVGATGLGKSTSFAGKMAKATGMRVLQVAPDADLKQGHGTRLRSLVKVSRIWTTHRQPVVTMMSVAEFCGRFMVDGWQTMDDSFDVVLLDEAHVPKRFFYAAKAALSSKGLNLSVLLMTATSPGSSSLQPSATHVYEPKRLEEIIEHSGFMQSAHVKDRALFLVESDERLERVKDLLYNRGCKVYALRSGASMSAIDAVRRAFDGDSPCVRVLVAHERFGTSYSLPVSRVTTTGLRLVLKEDESGFKYVATPVSALEVVQHLGRAGHSDAKESGVGIVLLRQSDLAPHVDLLESEKFATAVLLQAMGIKPGESLRTAVERTLPYGLSRRVAASVMNVVGLPPEITVRYLTEEGRLPASFSKALDKFSLDNVGTLAVRELYPRDYSNWVEARPYELIGETGGPVLKVPVVAEGELKAILTCVAAIEAKLFVPEAVARRKEDAEDSGPEESLSVKKVKMARAYVPERVLDTQVSEKELVTSGKAGFVLDIPVSRQPQYHKRSASTFDAGFINDLRTAMETPKLVESVDAKGRHVYEVTTALPEGSPVEVISGSTSLLLPKPLWLEMCEGVNLTDATFRLLIPILRHLGKEFAMSTAFSSFGNQWLSMFNTFTDPQHLSQMRLKGYLEELLGFFAVLWNRFVEGQLVAVQKSHVVRSFWERLVRSWSSSVVRPEVGRTNIAISAAFRRRLYDIRAGFANTLDVMEQQGVFDAVATAELQRILPVSRTLGSRQHDAVETGRAVPRSRPYVMLDSRGNPMSERFARDRRST